MVRVLSLRECRYLLLLVGAALMCNAVAVLAGAVAALSYLPGFKSVGGLTLQHLRPLHTTFGVAWIYLGGIALLHLHLFRDHDPRPEIFFRRLRWQLWLWGFAGLVDILSFLRGTGTGTGREYLEGPLVSSLAIYAGWCLMARNVFTTLDLSRRRAPVYALMWCSSIVLFLVSFAEAHVWLLPAIGSRPLLDLAVQWKSYGTLVGTFNLLVYGSLVYVGRQVRRPGAGSGSDRPLDYALFLTGLLNTATNFGHHTYHLPQSHMVKWVSFVVSMLEFAILFNVLRDVLDGAGEGEAAPRMRPVKSLLWYTTLWTAANLTLAILISIPPLNAFVHGTMVVLAHSMGSMIGIDSTGLWACLLFLLHTVAADRRSKVGAPEFPRLFVILEVTILFLVVLFAGKGLADGFIRTMGPLAGGYPRILSHFPLWFAGAGTLAALLMLVLDLGWFLHARRLAREHTHG